MFFSDLFDSLMGPYQVLSRQVRVNQEVMAMKRYSTFPISPLAQSGGAMEFTDCFSAEE